MPGVSFLHSPMNTSEKQRRKTLKRQYLEQDASFRELQSQKQIRACKIEDLVNTSDENLEWGIVQVILNLIEESSDAEKVLAGLPVGPRAMFATWLCEAEVMNGGFEQFFFNQKPYLWEYAREGYRLLRLPDCAAVIMRAISKERTGESDFEAEEDELNGMWERIKAHKVEEIRSEPSKYVIARGGG